MQNKTLKYFQNYFKIYYISHVTTALLARCTLSWWY